ncbi:hypothetical protein L873DRAFT_818130 [Choiromyces venosus 120613-1]|uniref:Uncharacterized protein n=1 Tax=Choiromyces venosus 120613-1 TaxID=1336337 RepID=A0A3N4JQM4_9PEZI|nr:hypothetical protein L873DRAFT_818130 [Choiromyces venosus 120613-1]
MLNKLLPARCAQFAGIWRSQNVNLICYTKGDPGDIIKSFENWAHGILFGTIRINMEERFVRRILYLRNLCSSPSDLNDELHQSNSSLQLAAPSQLLSLYVVLLFFPDTMLIPDHLFAFASYQRLVNYCLQTPEDITEAQKKKEKNKREKLGREGPVTRVEKTLDLARKEEEEEGRKEGGKGAVKRGEKAEEKEEGQKNTICDWATEMEDDDEVEEEVSTGEVMDETHEN